MSTPDTDRPFAPIDSAPKDGTWIEVQRAPDVDAEKVQWLNGFWTTKDGFQYHGYQPRKWRPILLSVPDNATVAADGPPECFGGERAIAKCQDTGWVDTRSTAAPAGTPRTDEYAKECWNQPGWWNGYVKMCDFARQLETELLTSATALSQAQRENAELRQRVTVAVNAVVETSRQMEAMRLQFEIAPANCPICSGPVIDGQCEECGGYQHLSTINKSLRCELSLLRQLIRVAWEQGFKLCRGYGDNHVHFQGEQRERQWLAFMAEHVTSALAALPATTEARP